MLPMPLSRIRGPLGVAILAALLAGCGRGPVPVEGIVTLDGQPVQGATVLFLPQGGQMLPAQAMTSGDGSFRLAMSGHYGAMRGEYKVLVTKVINTGQHLGPPPPKMGE